MKKNNFKSWFILSFFCFFLIPGENLQAQSLSEILKSGNAYVKNNAFEVTDSLLQLYMMQSDAGKIEENIVIAEFFDPYSKLTVNEYKGKATLEYNGKMESYVQTPQGPWSGPSGCQLLKNVTKNLKFEKKEVTTKEENGYIVVTSKSIAKKKYEERTADKSKLQEKQKERRTEWDIKKKEVLAAIKRVKAAQKALNKLLEEEKTVDEYSERAIDLPILIKEAREELASAKLDVKLKKAALNKLLEEK